MKVGEAMKAIRDMEMVVSRRGDEFRVNVPGGTEDTAYYTTDPDDAVCTARAMKRNHERRSAELHHIEARVRLV